MYSSIDSHRGAQKEMSWQRKGGKGRHSAPNDRQRTVTIDAGAGSRDNCMEHIKQTTVERRSRDGTTRHKANLGALMRARSHIAHQSYAWRKADKGGQDKMEL